jgi:SOS-response transcriptional repressor LexA
MSLAGLTQPQRACLTAIQFLTEDGVPPTYDQLASALGLASRSGVHRLLHQLKDRGLVTFEPRRAQSIRVLPTKIGPDELQALTSAELRTTAAHIAALLAQRETPEHAFEVFDQIARRVSGRPSNGGTI